MFRWLNDCPGPVTDRDCGAVYCPKGVEPEDDETWDECCDRCQDGEIDAAERLMDMRREGDV